MDQFTELVPSHSAILAWSFGRESNSRPALYKSAALASELPKRMVRVAGFEPALSCSQGRRVSRATLHSVDLAHSLGVDPSQSGLESNVQAAEECKYGGKGET